MPEATITLYGKPGCQQCTATGRKLDKEGLAYSYLDTSTDSSAYEKVEELGYQQLPVVTFGSEHWSGYRPDLIQQIAASQQ